MSEFTFNINKTYYVVTNDSDQGISTTTTYKTGINNVQPYCGIRGDLQCFFIVDKEHIQSIINTCSKWIREVRVTKTSKVIYDGHWPKYHHRYIMGFRVNEIIVSERRELYTIDSLIKYSLEPYPYKSNTNNNNYNRNNITLTTLYKIIENITKDDDLVSCIDWIKSNQDKCNHDDKLNDLLFDSAAFLNNTDIMNYLKENPFNFKDNRFVMRTARTKITMDQLKNKYPEEFEGVIHNLDMEIRSNKTEVIQWWFDSGYDIEYSENAISLNTNVETLQLLKDSSLDMKYTDKVIDDLCNYIFTNTDPDKLIEKLQWWKDSGLEMKYTDRSIDFLSYAHLQNPKMIEILNWWNDSGLEFKYSINAIDNIINSYDEDTTPILKWWKDSRHPLKYTKNWKSYWTMGEKQKVIEEVVTCVFAGFLTGIGGVLIVNIIESLNE